MRPNPRLLSVLVILTAPVAVVAQPWSAPGAGSRAGVRWVSGLPAASDQAKQTNKLVLLHFWSPSCGPCQLLENHVFNQPAVASAIHSQFVPVKVNVDQNADLAQRYKIRAVPTDVVLAADGTVVQKLVSPQTPMAYVSKLTEAHAKATSYAGRAFAMAASQAPFASSESGKPESAEEKPPLNTAYASLNIPKQQPVSPPPGPAPTPRQIQNRYASAAPALPATPPGLQPPTASPGPATPPGASQPGVSPLASQLPPGSPPLGLDGYCPVTMKRDRQWVLGNPRWGVRHQGRTYLFASQPARDEFLQNSVVYGPVLSGIDPVIYVETGNQVAGKRQFGTEYDELVFLFASEESLARFSNAPERYTHALQQRLAATRARSTTR